MPLNDYQFQVGSLVLGPGTNYTVTDWDGYGVPGFRTSDDPFPMDHGSMVGPEYLDGRTITLDILVRGTTPDTTIANAEAFIAAWYLDSTVDGYGARKSLLLKMPGQTERVLFGRPRRAEINPRRFVGNNAMVSAQFFAPDPRWYSSALFTDTLYLGVAASGRGYNKAFNYGYGGVGTSGSRLLTVGGNIATRPVIRLNGPMLNPVVFNETTGEYLSLQLELYSYDYLVLDFAARTVILNGTASRYLAKGGIWFELLPGTNSLRLNSSTYSATANAVVSWRSAWI